MSQILQDVHVLDFSTDYAGALAGALMADYGADVIKIEHPEGDPCRKLGPFAHGVSLLHCLLNRGKKSAVINLYEDMGLSIAEKLIFRADVIIENFLPGTMDALHLGYENASRIKPNIIYCSLTCFGQEGPYSKKQGNDLIAQAFCGTMHITGETDGPPMKHGMPVADQAGGLNAFGAIVTALCNKEFSGEGQYIDIATARTLLWMSSPVDRPNFADYPERRGNHHQSLSPYGLFNGKTGQGIILCGLNTKIWESVCDVIERPELRADPAFSILSNRVANRFKITDYIEEWLSKFDNIQDAVARLSAAGVPCAQVNGVREVVNDEHFNSPEVRWLVRTETPDSLKVQGMDTFLTHNVSATFSKTPGRMKKAPDLGQHTAEIFRLYDINEDTIKRKRRDVA